MGGWSSRVGDFQAAQMDYYYEDIVEKSESLEEITNQEVEVKVIQLSTRKEWVYSVPVEELNSIERNGTVYFLSHKPLGLRDWLFNRMKQAKKPILITPILNVINCSIRYYLQSPIGEENILIGLEPKPLEIVELSNFDWLTEKGFIYPH